MKPNSSTPRGAVALGLLALAMASAVRAEDACSALAARALPDATITEARVIAAGQYSMPQNPLTRLASFSGMNPAGRPAVGPNPAFCRVAATLRPSSDSDIKIEVWLPLNGWNGKLLGVGSFGWGGAMMYPAMLAGLEQGYATAATDTGHDSSTEEGKSGQFALGHPEKLIDYAWRADHLMTVHAKELIKAYYGKPASRAYWIGCSLGGLERGSDLEVGPLCGFARRAVAGATRIISQLETASCTLTFFILQLRSW